MAIGGGRSGGCAAHLRGWARQGWMSQAHGLSDDVAMAHMKDTAMKKAQVEELQLRLEMMSLALSALARALPAAAAATVVDALTEEVGLRLQQRRLSDSADAAMAADLGRLFMALQRTAA